jgi:hypothetical protein
MTVVTIALAFWGERFRCPRCAGLFCRKGWWVHNGFARRCLHCGIEVGTPSGDDPDA